MVQSCALPNLFTCVLTELTVFAITVPAGMMLRVLFLTQLLLAAAQERAMWERGQTDRDFFLASPADVGIAAVNK